MGLLLNLRLVLGGFPSQLRMYKENLVLWYKNNILGIPARDTRQNLLTYSEDFSNADWNVLRASTTAGEITSTTGAFESRAWQTFSGFSGSSASFQVESKATGTSDWLIILLWDTTANGVRQWFNVSTGELGGSTSFGTTYTKISASVEAAEDGYYLCKFSINAPSGSIQVAVEPSDGDLDINSALNASILARKVQLNEGDTADDYVKTEANPYSFKGDETQLNDFSASNNGGQIYSGGALSFDGVNDEVVTNKNFFSGSSSFSISVITSTTAPSVSRAILDERDAPSDGVAVGTNGSGKWFFSINSTTVTSTSNIVSGEYSRLDCVWDGATISLYVDGSLEDSAAFSGTISTSAVARLAGIAFTSAKYTGTIAEVLINNQALTASEALQNYNNPQQPITDGLEVWYGFDELNGGTLFDKSGNGYNATINGATWVSGVKEGFQPALSGFNNYQTFDGSDDYVSLTSNVFNGLSSFTVRGQFTASGGSVNTIIDERDGTSADGVQVYYFAPSGLLALRINTTIVTSTATIALGETCEFEIEWNGTQAVYTINGVAESPQAITETISTTQVAAIGRTNYTAANYFNGIIDYVEVEGVGRWYNLGGWVDEIGSNDGTVNGSPVSARIAGAEFNSTTDVFDNTIQNAYIANALNFSGGYNGLYVDAGANVDTSGAFSFAGWVYITEETVSGSRVFENIDLSSTSGMRLFYSTVSGDGEFRADFDSGATSQQAVSGISEFSPTGWYFLVLTKSSSGEANFYKATKTTSPAISGSANQAVQSSTPASSNMLLANRTSGAANLDGYLIYPLMYTEDLSSANTDLAPIEQIWDATKSLIPS